MSTNGKFEQVLVTPFAYLLDETNQKCDTESVQIGRAGERCPQCGDAALEEDGLLNLHCPRCDYVLAGSFT